ncbi:MAG: carboxypeptidase-like regulatory domain-containing protein [Bryobacteraceae bacterium]
MSERLLFGIITIAAIGATASAQISDPNPAHAPSVFLGNKRPPNKKDKTPTARSVTGKVVDASGQPLEGALVTVTDTKAAEKRTFITKKDGRYNFDSLSFTVDYQLQARYKDAVSEPRKLSQYDHTVNIVRILDVVTPASPTTEAKKEQLEPKK